MDWIINDNSIKNADYASAICDYTHTTTSRDMTNAPTFQPVPRLPSESTLIREDPLPERPGNNPMKR